MTAVLDIELEDWKTSDNLFGGKAQKTIDRRSVISFRLHLIGFASSSISRRLYLPRNRDSDFHWRTLDLRSVISHHGRCSQFSWIRFDVTSHSPKLHPGPCTSVGMRDIHTGIETNTQTAVTNTHIASATSYEKCNHRRILILHLPQIDGYALLASE